MTVHTRVPQKVSPLAHPCGCRCSSLRWWAAAPAGSPALGVTPPAPLLPGTSTHHTAAHHRPPSRPGSGPAGRGARTGGAWSEAQDPRCPCSCCCSLLLLHATQAGVPGGGRLSRGAATAGAACLGSQHAGAAHLLDLLLSQLGEELGLDHHGLVGQLALAQHLGQAVLGHINDGGNGLVARSGGLAGLQWWTGGQSGGALQRGQAQCTGGGEGST